MPLVICSNHLLPSGRTYIFNLRGYVFYLSQVKSTPKQDTLFIAVEWYTIGISIGTNVDDSR